MTSSLESQLRKRIRKTHLQSALLSSLEVAGVLAVALVAPNILQLFRKSYSTRSVTQTATRLEKKGLIAWDLRDGKKYIRLTPAGVQFLHAEKLFHIKKPKRWDGKWRIVTFDIAQKRSAQRTRLRQTLREIGFERLQDSVWVFPYDCEELITLLKAEYGLGKEVLYIIADSIERDSEIRALFKL